MKNVIEKKTCQICGEVLKGRRDQKFCSDQCRVEFHNINNSDVSKFMNNINNLLRKNRRILEKLNPTGKARVSKAHLLDEGFNFHYFTNMYTTKNGKSYHFIYEQGYIEIEDGVYTLVQKHEYVD